MCSSQRRPGIADCGTNKILWKGRGALEGFGFLGKKEPNVKDEILFPFARRVSLSQKEQGNPDRKETEPLPECVRELAMVSQDGTVLWQVTEVCLSPVLQEKRRKTAMASISPWLTHRLSIPWTG